MVISSMFPALILTVFGVKETAALIDGRIRCRTAIPSTVTEVKVKVYPHKNGPVKRYRPVLTYSVGAQTYTHEVDSSTTDPNEYYIGRSVTVYIDPKHPEHMRYDDRIDYFFAFAAVTLIGMVLLALSVLL